MCARVLVVEDEEAISQLLAYNLTKEGFIVEVSADGGEALIAVDEAKPDLVLMDWMLPNVSGVELCRRMRMGAETRDGDMLIYRMTSGAPDISAPDESLFLPPAASTAAP